MSSRNAITWLDAHDAFNRRDLDSVVAAFSPDCVYTDQARGITLKSPAEFQDWLGEWIRGFSDAETAEHAVFHAGDTVVCEFITRGTNNGPLGPLPPTGRRMSIPMVEVAHFDDDGQVLAAEVYFDQLSLLVQLGHVEPPPTA